MSLACHVGFLFALLWRPTPAPMPPESRPVAVELVPAPQPEPKPAPPAPPAAAKPAPPRPAKPARPLARQSHVRLSRTPAPARIYTAAAAADEGPAADSGDGVSEVQLAGAASADSGPAGGACDMARRLQSALRKDPLVRAAVAGSPGRALMVWNGDWVKHGAEDGKGLAAVREAIMWEVAFAPKPCRSEAVHGLILLSLNSGPGATRLALGQGEWRWSDLLASRR
ncbi:MAG TPA: hypothetical protein VIB82_04040 [Caulobacteraceae bacterium]